MIHVKMLPETLGVAPGGSPSVMLGKLMLAEPGFIQRLPISSSFQFHGIRYVCVQLLESLAVNFKRLEILGSKMLLGT